MDENRPTDEELKRLRMLAWVIEVYGLNAAIEAGLFSDKTLKIEGEIDDGI